MIDYRFDDMVAECVRNGLSVKTSVVTIEGEDYGLHTELFWKDVFINSAFCTIPKDPGLKLAEKL